MRMHRRDLVRAPERGTCIALYGMQEKAMKRDFGWSWSLRVVLALAVAVSIWAGAATIALGALRQRVRAAAPPASSIAASPASHR